MADNNAVLSLLGLCKKANKLSCGHDAAIGAIRSGQAKLCVLSGDSSKRLRDEAKREITMSKSQIPVFVMNITMDEIGRCVSLRSAILTVNDSGFAQSIGKQVDTIRRREENEC